MSLLDPSMRMGEHFQFVTRLWHMPSLQLPVAWGRQQPVLTPQLELNAGEYLPGHSGYSFS